MPLGKNAKIISQAEMDSLNDYTIGEPWPETWNDLGHRHSLALPFKLELRFIHTGSMQHLCLLSLREITDKKSFEQLQRLGNSYVSFSAFCSEDDFDLHANFYQRIARDIRREIDHKGHVPLFTDDSKYFNTEVETIPGKNPGEFTQKITVNYTIEEGQNDAK